MASPRAPTASKPVVSFWKEEEEKEEMVQSSDSSETSEEDFTALTTELWPPARVVVRGTGKVECDNAVLLLRFWPVVETAANKTGQGSKAEEPPSKS
jgi:hypothetical protein